MINKLKQSLILYLFLFQNIIGTNTNIEFWIDNGKNEYIKPNNDEFKINLNELKNIDYNEAAVKEQINYLIYIIYMWGYENFYKDIFSEKTLNKELVFYLKDYIDNYIKGDYYITSIYIFTSNNSQIYDLQKKNLENIIKQINRISVYISNSKQDYIFDDDSKEYIINYDKYFHSEMLSEEKKCILEFIKSAIGKGIYYSINHNYERLKKIGLLTKQKNKNDIFGGFKIIPYYDINGDEENNLRNIKLYFREECFDIKINTYQKASIFLENFKVGNNNKILNNIVSNHKYYTLVNEDNENLCYYRIPNDDFTHHKVVNKDDLIQPEMRIELDKVHFNLLRYNGKTYNKVESSTTIDIENLFNKVREIIIKNKKNFKIKYINFDSECDYSNNNNVELKDMPNNIGDFIETIKKELKPYVDIVLIAKTEEEKQKEQEEQKEKEKIDESDLFIHNNLFSDKNLDKKNSKNDMFNNDVNDNKNIKNNINLNNRQNIDNINVGKRKYNPIMNNNINGKNIKKKNIKEKSTKTKPVVNNSSKTDSINKQNSNSSQKNKITNNDGCCKGSCSCR